MATKSLLRQSLSNLRQHLNHARIPDKFRFSQDTSNLIGLARSRTSRGPKIRLRFSNKFAYRFRYLHLGLTKLAGQSLIDYHFRIDKSLGRKTAVIEYLTGTGDPTIAVIDASARSWQLGDPDIDLNAVFGSLPRILFKVEYGLSLIDNRSAGRHDPTLPTIKQMYQQVLDGAYWPINEKFLDGDWVRAQQKINGADRDLFAAYGLQADDIIPDERHGGSDYSERVEFEQKIRGLLPDLDAGVLMRMYLLKQMYKFITMDEIPEHIKVNLDDTRYPFDEYLHLTLTSKLNYAPKNTWHAMTSDLTAHRTYRLLELFALGRVVLTSPTQLHIPIEPNQHYVAINPDLSDLKQVIERAVHDDPWRAQIRANVLPLYEHISPTGIAKHYVSQLRKLHTGKIPRVAWELTQ